MTIELPQMRQEAKRTSLRLERRAWWWALAAFAASEAAGQQMDARLYANPPVGVNFLIAGMTYLWGDIALDPSLPIKGANAEVPAASLAYARSIDVFGQSGTVAVTVPYAWVSASGIVEGQDRRVNRSGPGDIMVRLAANLYGAPALTLEQFREYQQDTIIGISLLFTSPTGQYDPDKLINIGTNRWSIKPEIGVSKAVGNWIFEGAFGVTFFAPNNQFLGDNSRKQDPLYAVQGHLIYTFSPALWGSLDTTYYWGGATSVNGGESIDRQENWRGGATLSHALGRQSSVKVYAATGVAARAGSNFNALGVAFEYRWGAGL